jgi:hypothetical protein
MEASPRRGHVAPVHAAVLSQFAEPIRQPTYHARFQHILPESARLLNEAAGATAHHQNIADSKGARLGLQRHPTR